jgi:Na+/proline symporter
MAAILAASMSNLSAALNSLASTTVLDIIRPLRMARENKERQKKSTGEDSASGLLASDTHMLRLARLATVAWGVVLAFIALLARHWGSVLQAGLSIASVAYGALLGVFLLGLLTKRVRETDAMIGMAAGLAAMIYVRFATSIAFTWYVLIGSAVTFLMGLAISAFHPSEQIAIAKEIE